jgi:hypothetical protein
VSRYIVAGSVFGGTNRISKVLGKEGRIAAVPVNAPECLSFLSLSA